MNSLSLILKNRWLRLALAAVLLQQALVATGTYLMGDLAGSFSVREPSPALLLFLFACVILPGTVVHYLINVTSVRANKTTLLAYFRSYAAANYNQPTHWRESASRGAKHDVLTKTGQDSLLSTNAFVIDMAATVLNVVLNTASVILVTNIALGAAIFTGGIAGIVLVHLADKKISAAATEEMRTESTLNAQLARSWDNILLGNTLFFGRWKERLENLFRASAEASYANVGARDGAVAIAGFVTNGIVMGTALALAWFHRDQKAFAVAIIVMLPRSLQTTNHLQIIQGYWAQWKTLRERLRLVDESLRPLTPVDLSRHIQHDALHLRDVASGAPATISVLRESKLGPGRYVLTGENGAGKSTFLLQLKNELGEKAVYLPAHHQLEGAESSLSSGQTAMAFLKDLAAGDAEVLLLDEWDANLSSANRELFDQLVKEISTRKLVVEIRHSHG